MSKEKQVRELLLVKAQREWIPLQWVLIYVQKGWEVTWTQLREFWWKASEERQAGELLQVKVQREWMPPQRVTIYAQRDWGMTWTQLRESW